MDRSADQLGGLGRALEVGQVSGPRQLDADGSRQPGRELVGDRAEPGKVAGAGDDRDRARDAGQVNLDVIFVDVGLRVELHLEGVG